MKGDIFIVGIIFTLNFNKKAGTKWPAFKVF